MTVSLLGWLVALASASTLVGCRLRARRRDVLLARASHELRGPLQAVMLGLSGLDRAADPEARVRVLEGELRRVVVALGDLDEARARRRASSAVTAVATVDLAALVREQVAAWTPLAAARGRVLTCATGPGPCPVVGDAARLGQATGNLLANALEHGRGPVVVTVRAEGPGTARVEVRDQGPGLAQPLDRLLARAGGRVGAHGHGLAVAADVARRYGGRLGTVPGAPGSRLVLELPVVTDTPPVAA